MKAVHYQLMPTWNLFTGSDLSLAVVALLGFVSVATVINYSFRKVNDREMGLPPESKNDL